MKKQWNFIFDNKLITVFAKDGQRAEEKARAIFDEMQRTAGE